MTDLEFLDLRKKVIRKDFSRMNDMQFLAVTKTDGPVLVLAGAGSGKTTVLVNRIACLVKYGNAYNSTDVPFFSESDVEQAEAFIKNDEPIGDMYAFSENPAKPWEILAITFTNKAAGELKERISLRLGDTAKDIWAGTFHSVCGKILRRFADRIGYTSHFTIYDTDDQKKIMKELMKQCRVDEKFIPVKTVLSHISSAKDKLISPEEFAATVGSDLRLRSIATLYEAYNKNLRDNNAMDFDDMIVNTVKLFKENEDVLDYYSRKFRYIMVDEYQDTNHAQYMLVKLLSTVHGNICVVGDDDQSIYKFRGATIENILSFEKHYKNATVIRLEQNYRSTSNILDAANAVIKNNAGRKGKNLWTNSGEGEKITVNYSEDEQSEAHSVANGILTRVSQNGKFGDNAILYRMNAQSRAFENIFARSGIPYRIIGGLKFYDRKEIKDVLAYLNVINNPADDLRLKRIVNEPKRAIGDTTVQNAELIAMQTGNTLFNIFKNADEFAQLSRSAAKLMNFANMIEQLREIAETEPLDRLLEEVLEQTGYRAALQLAGSEEQERLDNIGELATGIIQYVASSDEPTLSGYLEDIALITDLDNFDSSLDAVVMMTVHSAKGLEFNNVYIVGMEEGIFPGNQSIFGGPDEIEEERRLAYVAITRAKKELTVSTAYTRMMFGMTNRNLPSRFLKEIPEELCVITGTRAFTPTQRSSSFGEDYGVFGRPQRERSTQSFKSSFAPSPASKSTECAFTVGQQVKHSVFGVGMVIKAVPMAGDTMLEIAFDSVGTKKLMANFAKLTAI
ncbi:MAG: UvrD-helicase domain-containing protein [Clostridia bacterium]|nr:UvrD-helicase domain-containing protein [Clostridia bacterium]